MIPTTSPTMTKTTTKTRITAMTTNDHLVFWEPCRLWSLLLLLVVVNPVLSAYSRAQPSRDWRNPDDDSELAGRTISVSVGQTAYLPCRVRNLGDKVVSWIRMRDLQILTSHTITFTSDSRFEIMHTPGTEMWTLRIMSVQPRDQGKYECQVNTDPKINFAVILAIKETDMKDDPGPDNIPTTVTATALIEGPREQYVSRDTTVTFTCVIMAPYSISNRPPREVHWFHSDRLISIQSQRGGIIIETEKSDLHTKSRLTVAAVTYRDAGNYTCRPSDTRPATVQLIVVEGEHTEAMQRDGEPSKASRSSYRPLQYQFILLFSLHAFHFAGIT